MSTSLLVNSLLINSPETGSMINTAGGPRTTYGARGESTHPTIFAASSGTILNLNVPGELPGTCLVSTSQNINFFPAAFLKFVFLIYSLVKILHREHHEEPVR